MLFCSAEKSGAVVTSRPGIASVCSGDQLELTCNTPGSIFEWAFAPVSAAIVYRLALSTTNQAPAPLLIDSI